MKRLKQLGLLILLVGLGLFSIFFATSHLQKNQETRSEASVSTEQISKHLFVDEYLLDKTKSSNFKIQVNPPTNFREVIATDKPWEAVGYHYYSRVLPYNLSYEGQDYKYIIYYGRWNMAQGGSFETPGIKDETGYLCVGLSNDGLNWTKPIFSGSGKFNGQNTNCLKYKRSDNNFVLDDPNAPTSQRFKLFGALDVSESDPYFGAWGLVAYSADGMNFTTVNKRLGPINSISKDSYGLDSQNVVLWDDEDGIYRFYVRGRTADYRNNRWISNTIARAVNYAQISDKNLLTTKKYLLDFSSNPHPLYISTLRLTDEIPYTMIFDSNEWEKWSPGEKGTVDLYHSSAFKYPGTSRTYLAFPTIYYHFTQKKNPGAYWSGNDGEFEPQFASSRDGTNWNRYKRIDGNPPYVDRGIYQTKNGNVNFRMLSMGQGMIFESNKIYQYFIALPRTHGSGFWLNGKYVKIADNIAAWKNSYKGGVYVAEQRLDGFAGLKSQNNSPATITTEPFYPAGNTLKLNAKVESGGYLKVAVLDQNANAITGYSVSDSGSYTGDFIDKDISWGNKKILPNIASTRPIRLKFELSKATVFAMNFENFSGTISPTAIPTVKPSNTPVPPTPTTKPVNTPTPKPVTPTQVPPTATVKPVATSTPRPTATPTRVPVTNTPRPTNTLVPATPTQVPATPTSTSAPTVTPPPPTPTIPLPTLDPSCNRSSDINGDGLVDIIDISLLINVFFQNGENITADLDCSGRVDILDYARVVRDFRF